MTERVLTAWVRSCQEIGTRPSRRLRRQGFIPAVVYGKSVPNGNLPIKLVASEVRKVLGPTIPELKTPVRLRVHMGDDVLEFDTVLQEVQWDPMRLDYRHLDFFVPAVAEEKVQPEGLAPAA
ncbi:large subunit ribosomal protein L25 [Candidatus Fervidibacteria bacterium JGI MDM2 SSWTFF-3-K9]